MPHSTIFQLYRGGQFYLVEETWVPVDNHRPIANYWQALSHNVLSNGVRIHNWSGDRQWLHM